jgi:hypothetical protein
MTAMTQTGIEKVPVQFFKTLDNGDGNQVVAPDISDRPFNAPLLMGASRIAETGGKIIIRPEFTEALLLDPIAALQNLLDSARQVIVNDSGKNAAEEIKSMNVSVKKGLLLLTGISPYKVLAGKPGAKTEIMKGCPYSPEDGDASAPVGVRLPAAVRLQDQKNARRLCAQSCFGQTNIAPDIYLAALVTLLRDQAGVYPPSRVPLLLRNLPVIP